MSQVNNNAPDKESCSTDFDKIKEFARLWYEGHPNPPQTMREVMALYRRIVDEEFDELAKGLELIEQGLDQENEELYTKGFYEALDAIADVGFVIQKFRSLGIHLPTINSMTDLVAFNRMSLSTSVDSQVLQQAMQTAPAYVTHLAHDALNLVSENNLTKFDKDGKGIWSDDGKLLKPEGFTPVDLTSITVDSQVRKSYQTQLALKKGQDRLDELEAEKA